MPPENVPKAQKHSYSLQDPRSSGRPIHQALAQSLMWTKTSAPSYTMKPQPFTTLNDFTVPWQLPLPTTPLMAPVPPTTFLACFWPGFFSLSY